MEQWNALSANFASHVLWKVRKKEKLLSFLVSQEGQGTCGYCYETNAADLSTRQFCDQGFVSFTMSSSSDQE